MKKTLEGKVAIVTGAGRGIGKGEAMLLAREGAKVVVNDMGGGFDGAGQAAGPADEVVAEIKAAGGEAVANYESVTDYNGAKKIIDCAIDTFGQLNILVNNAGILRDRMIFNMAEEEFDAVMDVHVKGTFNCSRHACSYWREQHKAGNLLNGRIISTASDAGLLFNPGQVNYGGAKAAIASMTIIMGKEMARYGVTCNSIAPMARTRLTTDATPATAPLMGNVEEIKNKAGWDVLDPDNIAPLIACLASDAAKDINGQVFRVGGGLVWLMESWRSADKIKKDGKWEPSEMAPKLVEMVQKAKPPEEMTALFGELGLL